MTLQFAINIYKNLSVTAPAPETILLLPSKDPSQKWAVLLSGKLMQEGGYGVTTD